METTSVAVKAQPLKGAFISVTERSLCAIEENDRKVANTIVVNIFFIVFRLSSVKTGLIKSKLNTERIN